MQPSKALEGVAQSHLGAGGEANAATAIIRPRGITSIPTLSMWHHFGLFHQLPPRQIPNHEA